MVCASDLRALCNSQEPGHVYKNKSNAQPDTRPSSHSLPSSLLIRLRHCYTLHMLTSIYVHYLHGHLLGPLGHLVASCNFSMSLVDFVKNGVLDWERLEREAGRSFI